MKNKLNIFILIFFPVSIHGMTFKEVVQNFSQHEAVKGISAKSNAFREEAVERGSWGDPHFSLAAKNYPKNSLKDDVSSMTGIVFGLSQKIALTTKYGNIESAFKSLSKSYVFKAKNREATLTKKFLGYMIVWKKVEKIF